MNNIVKKVLIYKPTPLDLYRQSSYICIRNTPTARGEEDVEPPRWPGDETSISEEKSEGKRGESLTNASITLVLVPIVERTLLPAHTTPSPTN